MNQVGDWETTGEDSRKYCIVLPGAANGAIHLHTMTIILSTTVDTASRRTGSANRRSQVASLVVVVLVAVVVVVVVLVVVAPCLHWHSFPWRNKGSVPKASFAHSMLPSTRFGLDQVSPCP